ncbi:hypothetical protein [Vulcaniibacterium tengchongense]|uniref:Uncharacterized protein n=1 Tax=Vulcaniibacterium tengchongense TaxID=1273429 RepID=A0A3N4VAR5_9GAMM|nr:hypothetical protein [Vulcaniibacterium tengchongense]RPE79668.1 hypothetical protein EDC50_1491 [Vulcaniibacterium tengchongense]
MRTWEDVKATLSELRDDVPRMLREHPDRSGFYEAFSRAADRILGEVPAHLYESAVAEVSAILHDFEVADDGQD